MTGDVSGMALELAGELEALREANLLRSLRRVDSSQGVRVRLEGREFLNLSSNDYLGLASHSALKEAASRAASEWGAGAGASRLVCGSLGICHELEEALAAFKRLPAALVFSTGYAAALGAIPALVGKDDIVIVDKLVHACVVDAARLSQARLRVFRHNDLEDLESKLQWAAAQSTAATRPRVLVVTESVFSMDGDIAPLAGMVELKERHGAWLMVDEAHATGVMGPQGRGLIAELGLTDRVEIQMGTLGKALGASGGFIAGHRTLIDTLINRARSFVFSTAPPPAMYAAALAGLKICEGREGDGLRARLGRAVAGLAGAAGSRTSGSPILPLMVGAESGALALSKHLFEAGILAPAIRYPTVARGAARLRLTASAALMDEDFLRLKAALATWPDLSIRA